MAEIDEATILQIQSLCGQGDEKAELGLFEEALDFYWEAFDLIPDPKTDYEASTWVLTAVGDANFLNSDFETGRDNLSNAMHCPDAIGNPFIHLRLGQCQFELGNMERALDEFMRAYMGAGGEIFTDDDPKYFAFLEENVELD